MGSCPKTSILLKLELKHARVEIISVNRDVLRDVN